MSDTEALLRSLSAEGDLEAILALSREAERRNDPLLYEFLGAVSQKILAEMRRYIPVLEDCIRKALDSGSVLTDPYPLDDGRRLILLDYFQPSGKIPVIKEIRALTGLGLKEAKRLVDHVPAVLFNRPVSQSVAFACIERMKKARGTLIYEFPHRGQDFVGPINEEVASSTLHLPTPNLVKESEHEIPESGLQRFGAHP